jgi:hypothetical protein
MTRNELIRIAWETGNLEYLVNDYQLVVYHALWAAIREKKTLKYALNVARRFGKTHVTTIVAFEFAIRNPNSIINYAAPTNKEMQKILRSMIPNILSDCPADMRPVRKNGTWEFNNGSIIYTAGVNNDNADNLRGNKADLNIVDEAGQIDNLDYLVRSVLIPQQLTTAGTMLLLSTPPSVTDHDFARMFHECLEEGNAMTLTVFDNAKAMADKELFDSFVKESGGQHTTTWLREFECQFVTDTNKIIMPEWATWKATNTVDTPRTEKFHFWHKYVGMDLGFKHNTCLIFGHYDFERAKMVIEKDFVVNGTDVTSASISKATVDSELELWGEEIKTLVRISDNNNPILLNDIYLVHKILFHPTSKDNLLAMVNKTRSFIGSGRLEIHPRCEYLLGCLEYGVWNKQRDGFAESKKYGHYDGLAALIYLLRYVDEHTNPIPLGWGTKQDDVMFYPVDSMFSPSAQGLQDFSRAINKKPRHMSGVN